PEFHLICCKTFHWVSSPSRQARAFPIPSSRESFHSFFLCYSVRGDRREMQEPLGDCVRLLGGCSLLCGPPAALHKWDYGPNDANQQRSHAPECAAEVMAE